MDVRYALRTMLKSPGFTFVAVLTLALGIGANTAIFSVIDAVLLRPLPYPNADRILVVGSSRTPGEAGSASQPDYLDWRKDNQSFTELALWYHNPVNYVGGDRPVRLEGVTVTANIFTVLGARPALGRLFAAGEDRRGQNHVAVLTHQGWVTRFRADPSVIGQVVQIDGEPHTVIGVLPADFRFALMPADLDVWLPFPRATDIAMTGQRSGHYFQVLGLLKPGVTVAQAKADLDVIQARLAVAHPEADASRFMTVRPLHEELVKDVRASLYLLLGAVALVLLIACANVANLMLARASARHRELAIRVALGAGRRRLVRQLLTESLILSIFGAAAGTVLALWGLDLLHAVVPRNLARLHSMGLDARVLGFTVVVAAVTGLVFGIVPALQASASNPGDALKQAGGRATGDRGRQRAKNLFVAAELALAVVLLVLSGLMIRSFQKLSGVDPGFEPHGLLTATVVLPDQRYHHDPDVVAFYKQLLPRLAAIPGVTSAAAGVPLPFSDDDIGLSFSIVGQPPPAPGHDPVAKFRSISPGFFEAMHIPLRSGRGFTDADDDHHAEQVVVVSEAFARKYFPGEDPLGKKMQIGWGADFGDAVDVKTRRIVGVAVDAHFGTLEQTPEPAMYVPFGQAPLGEMMVAVRSSSATGLGAALRDAVASVDKDQPIDAVQTMDSMVQSSLAERRVGTTLLGLFGGLALLLALVGVYGVMSYAVSQRTQEIGIRVALGARRREVVAMVLFQGLSVAVGGIAAGVALALAVTRLVQSRLYQVGAADPVTYAVIVALLLGVAALASWLPARRAARVDPMVALRAE